MGITHTHLVITGDGLITNMLVDSVLRVPLGTAAKPTLHFWTGNAATDDQIDDDTGLWSPGANTMAWSTGGTERMRLDSAGVLNLAAADKLKVDSIIVPQRVVVTMSVPAGAAAADYDGLFFIADAAYQVVTVRERHQTAGSDAGAVTLMVKKVPSATAKASGTDVLAAGINLKATADTIQTASLHATAGNYQLAAGDALGLVATGVLTAVDGVTVAVELKRI